MPTRSTKPGWIEWRTCNTRSMILEDLASGLVPLDTSPEDAWNAWYSHTAEVQAEQVVFDQFRERFADHVKQMNDKKVASIDEKNLFLRHRQLHPIQKRNDQGQLIFEQHKANTLLLEDVKSGKHKQMSATSLQMSRPEYQEFSLVTFRGRIPQMVRHIKYLNWLDDDRKQKAHRKKERLKEITGVDFTK